ncbi:MAG: YdcF family protein, partial [Clostridia bacterium]|nr:YdcF family protein [Clostridia bacterium]
MKNTPYDAIIVLGAQVRPEGVPSEALRRRLTVAFDRYVACPAPIICCGAQGPKEPAPEGEFMRQWLLERGVKPEHAFSENASTDTIQNIQNAKRIMADQALSRPLVVTSDYHLPRALAI